MTTFLKGQIIFSLLFPPPYSKDGNRKACYIHLNNDLNELQEEVKEELVSGDNSVLDPSCDT